MNGISLPDVPPPIILSGGYGLIWLGMVGAGAIGGGPLLFGRGAVRGPYGLG